MKISNYTGKVINNYTGSVGRPLSAETIALQNALTESLETDQWKVIGGTSEADLKKLSGKLHAVAARQGIGVHVRLTEGKGEIAFKAKPRTTRTRTVETPPVVTAPRKAPAKPAASKTTTARARRK